MFGLCSQYQENALITSPGEQASPCAAVEYGNSYYWWYYYVPTSRCHVPEKDS